MPYSEPQRRGDVEKNQVSSRLCAEKILETFPEFFGGSMISVRVDCYAGYRGDERPVRFVLGERVFEVEQVEDQWYSPSAKYFRVRAGDGNLYVLRHDQTEDLWTLEGFRAPRPRPDEKV